MHEVENSIMGKFSKLWKHLALIWKVRLNFNDPACQSSKLYFEG